jgi:hypothetical protein
MFLFIIPLSERLGYLERNRKKRCHAKGANNAKKEWLAKNAKSAKKEWLAKTQRAQR